MTTQLLITLIGISVSICIYFILAKNRVSKQIADLLNGKTLLEKEVIRLNTELALTAKILEIKTGEFKTLDDKYETLQKRK